MLKFMKFYIIHHLLPKKQKHLIEEKQVADKAPIESISVNDLNLSDKKIDEVKLNKFNYTIKIADFYFKDTAMSMIDRINKETFSKKNWS